MNDLIAYVSDIEALTVQVQEKAPHLIGEDGSWLSMYAGPIERIGLERLAYRRVSDSDLELLQQCPAVHILSHAPYEGDSVADLLYDEIFADPELKALYERVHPLETVQCLTGDVIYTLTADEPVEATVTFEMPGSTATRLVQIDGSTEVQSMVGVPITVTPDSVSVSEPVAVTYTHTPSERFGAL